MNRIDWASERLTAAIDLPGVLDSAYDAFEDVLAVLRHHQEDDEAAFAAFMFRCLRGRKRPGLDRLGPGTAAGLAARNRRRSAGGRLR